MSLKIKAQKIEAWWVERGQYYRDKFRFVGMTLTFRDMEAYLDFERHGGRRVFMKNYKRYCERKAGKEAIIDYVCVAEFQERGMIHYHYLLVVPWDVKLPFPDESVFKWGMSNLVSLRGKNVRGYLASYIKKMKQISYFQYSGWKAMLGRSFRLYEFARSIGRGILNLLNRGWGRCLYWRVLRHVRDGWRFVGKGNNLVARGEKGWYMVKPKWYIAMEGSRLFLKFMGFCVLGPEGYARDEIGLDELEGCLRSILSS